MAIKSFRPKQIKNKVSGSRFQGTENAEKSDNLRIRESEQNSGNVTLSETKGIYSSSMPNQSSSSDEVQNNKKQSSKQPQNTPNQPKDKVSLPPIGNDKVRLIPLGGAGNVTKNMWVYECGEDIVIIDCGIGFPDEGMPGVDLVIPDITYLKDKVSRIKGIIITHAHEDHIGSLPYLWPDLKCPIYSQRLTTGLIKAKFDEHRLPKDQIKTVGFEDTIKLGTNFEASFYLVSHSIPDSMGIVLKTPIGKLIHQADFKIDWTPVNGQVTDIAKLARMSEDGVVFMTLDCLRSEKSGYTLSEKTIQSTFEKVERETKGKMLITMTSSNVTRVQQAINVAVASNRKIALSGRSMEGTFQVARDLGYLDIPPGLIIAQEELKRFKDENLMILIAGSQGQAGSSLSRAANGDHKYVQLMPGDSVVFSADPIPGNESPVSAMIDNLLKRGCNVYYSAHTPDLHVSGHAAAEELKIMINLAKPKYLLPIGGEYRHMKTFADLAMGLGYKDKQILLPRDGQVMEITSDKAYINGKVQLQNVYIDGLGIGDVGSIVLRDRQVMAEEGIVIVLVPVDPTTGKLSGDTDLISRGFVFEQGGPSDLMQDAKRIVLSYLKEQKGDNFDWRYLRRNIEDSLEKFFFQELKRQPLILPLIVEV